MSDAKSRVIVLILVLALAIFWSSRPAQELADTADQPMVYDKGRYLGPKDTPLDKAGLEQLKDRARTDVAPRL